MTNMRFASIQVMRAVAALSVVFFHASSFRLGEAGVDIFFVISGFIMGTIGVRERPGEFLTKRIIRIVPLYWGVTLAMCVGAMAGVYSHFTFTIPQLVKSLLFIPYYNPEGNIWPLAVTGWTLNYEMFFYLFFALGLLLRCPILLPTVALMLAVVFGLLLHPEGAALHSYTDPLLLEFCAGLLLSQAPRFRGQALGLALLAAGLAVFAVLVAIDWYPTSERVILFGIPAFAMVAGAVAVERAGRWPSLPFAEKIGDASYSLYLLHGIAIAFLHKLPQIFLVTPFIMVALSLTLSLAAYHMFEKPVSRFLVKRLVKS